MNEEPRDLPLILASGSAARRALLERLGLPFEIISADIDENPLDGETPESLVMRLARNKASAVALDNPDAIVIGSDQVAAFNGEATSKPGSAERAREYLARFSGQRITFLTGVCVQWRAKAEEHHFTDHTVVQFRDLSNAEIERYVALDDPLACAGAFKVESLGPTLFTEVLSKDPTGLPGLPLIGLSRCLRELGFALP